MKAFLLFAILTSLQMATAQVSAGLATVEASKYSEWVTFQVHGKSAQQLYNTLKVAVQVGGVKRGPGITCVKAKDGTYYCSMSVNPAGEVEGDGISSTNPHPGVGMGNR